jgi:hypothetical protein
MHKKQVILVLLLFYGWLTSCSVIFNAYLRNTTDRVATVDVYLLSKQNMKTLPNKVGVANRVVAFKSGYRKYIDSLQNVDWIDTNHFKLEMAPKTTVDLTDMAGRFRNGDALHDVRVTVTLENRTDTILYEAGRNNQLHFKSMGFGTPVLYYDIK